MFTRKRLLGIAAAGGALFAASCGAGGTAAPSGSKAPVRLQMYNQTGSQQAVTEWTETLAVAQQKLPHVTFDVGGPTGSEQFVEKATAMGAAGTPPDLTYSVTRNGPAVFTGGMTHDMNTVVKREKIDLAGVAKNVLDDFNWKGALLALPYDTGFAYIRYNKTLFDKAGVKDPGALWTEKKWDWDAFVAAGTALSRPVMGGPQTAGFSIRTWEGDYLSIVRTWGGDLLNADRTKLALDEGPSVAALEKWAELATRHKASMAPNATPQGGFHGQLLAMISGHPGEIVATQKFTADSGTQWTWDIVPHPLVPGKKRVPVLFTNGLYLWKNTRNEATSVEVLKALMGQEAMLRYGAVSGRDPAKAPLIPDHAKNLGIPQQDPKSYLKMHQELTSEVRGLPHTVNYVEWHTLVQQEILTPVGRGEKSPQDAARAAAPAINAILTRR
jgi:multiple sugar transport system substrate-binding protein